MEFQKELTWTVGYTMIAVRCKDRSTAEHWVWRMGEAGSVHPGLQTEPEHCRDQLKGLLVCWVCLCFPEVKLEKGQERRLEVCTWKQRTCREGTEPRRVHRGSRVMPMRLVMEVHAFNPSTQEAGADGSPSLRSAQSTEFQDNQNQSDKRCLKKLKPNQPTNQPTRQTDRQTDPNQNQKPKTKNQTKQKKVGVNWEQENQEL